MSAGAFVTSKYSATYDTSAIHPIRVQPETIAATIGVITNAAPTGEVNNPIQARVSGGRRSIGLVARSVTLRASSTASDVPDGYALGGITRIPALTTAFYDAAIKGVAVTYLTKPFKVVSRSSELPE